MFRVVFCAFILTFPLATFSGSHFLEYTNSGSKVLREWDPPIIKWRYNPDGAPEGAKEIIEAAFSAWNNEAQSTAVFEFAGTTSQASPALDGFCDIFFKADFASLGLSNDIIAVTFRNGSLSDTVRTKGDRILEDADIVVNPSLANQWITGVPVSAVQLDLQEILTHEIGHLLGLAHSFLIDSMMYPAKPRSSTDPVLKALFRVPKRTLSNDDAAWLGALYPNDNFKASTASVSGRVQFEDEDFVGAHIIAIKVGESDLSMGFYPNESSGDLMVKGLSNVSAFSEEDGEFEMHGLLPGSYVFAIQDVKSFLTFGLANVNDFLRVNASVNVIPTAYFLNPDCSDGAILSPTTIDSNFSALQPLSLSADRALCGVNFIAHTGAQKCLSLPSESSSCGGDGGCSMDESAMSQAINWKALGLSLLGIIIIMFSLKLSLKPPAKPSIKKGPSSKK